MAFVERLVPSLAETLPPNVVAVVSRTGGRLSHFAIVARERGLPTFVSPSLRPSEFEGKTVGVSDSGIEILAQSAVIEPVTEHG
ncbi:MAG: PEP-utilizing enzyme [Patescibacteria group bacterium]